MPKQSADFLFRTFIATTFTPGAFAKFSLGLLYDQATVQTPAWGSGANGLKSVLCGAWPAC
jgi:hypothetical protein